MSAPPADSRLCYISGGFAYFTLADDAHGDDWNDAPWWCNAGEPYDRYIAGVVAYVADVDEQRAPDLSVDDINAGRGWWLRVWGDCVVEILGGTTYAEFCRLIRLCGGRVFVEVDE